MSKIVDYSINGLAQAIRVPANRISLIVNEKRGITTDTAARLGRYFWHFGATLAEHPESLRSRLHRLGRNRAGRDSEAGRPKLPIGAQAVCSARAALILNTISKSRNPQKPASA